MGVTGAAAGGMFEKPPATYAWVLLFIGSAFLVVYAIIVLVLVALMGQTFSNRTWAEVVAFSPGLAPFFVYSGTSILGLGVLGMAISAFSYRKGERWAWCALWYLPAFAVAGEVTDIVILSGHAYSFLVIAALSVLGLLLPIRRFFPRRISSSA